MTESISGLLNLSLAIHPYKISERGWGKAAFKCHAKKNAKFIYDSITKEDTVLQRQWHTNQAF